MKQQRISMQQAFDVARQFQNAGQLAEAESLYRQLIAQRSDLVDARYGLAMTLRQGGRAEESIQALRELLAIDPSHFDAHNALGDALQSIARLDEAITSYRQALALRPDFAEAHNNLASALQDMGQVDEAIATFRNAVALAPQNAVVHYNYALTLLLNGQLQHGFIEHEWRWQVPQLGLTKRQFPQPRWEGEDPSGKRLLLYCEQGFGDSIQFLRYVPILAARGADLVIQLPRELMRLAESVEGARRLVQFGDPLPEFDCHASLMSLPRLLKTTLETVPANVPYLRVDPEMSTAWRERVETADAGKLKVGLAWAGRREHWNDRNRSLPADALELLMSQHFPVTFFSLQKNPSRQSPTNMIDWTAEFNDFADTAALVENLDMVISVDTAVAHLAGAIGKRVWLLLPFAPDWRWLRDRTDSPWYPTMRLYRQRQIGDWRGCIETLISELRDLVGAS